MNQWRQMKPWPKRIVAGLALLATAVAILLAYAYWPVTPDLSYLAAPDGMYQVEIRRDSWGVPHIYGRTDADAAFGLAYAHAEDDFLTIQNTLAAARGQLGQLYGPDSAPIDYVLGLLRIRETIAARYDTDVAPEARAIAEAYAAGLNHYAAHHPDEAFLLLFPITGPDIIAGFMLRTPLFFGLDRVIGELFAAERQRPVSQPAAHLQNPYANLGSNTFAIAPQRSADGSTWLAINSHQPWDGPVAWYEAHIQSETGWNAYGGLFPGAPVILHGFNDHLGWAFAVNSPDLVDVFVLEMNPDNPNQYRFDGQWRDLERWEVPIRVKLFGRVAWTVRREALWSVYGPTVRQPHGVYAIRFASMGELGYLDQWLALNKAGNLSEWQAAMAGGPIPMFNVGYADRSGNIYYLYNGRLPLRSPGYDWRQYLPGDASETLWTEYLPFDQLPQTLNPPSGFIQNANSSPFQTTLGVGNPNPADYPASLGIETTMSNRALRLLELLGGDAALTKEEFVAVKYDMGYTADSDVARLAAMVTTAPPPADIPDWATAVALLNDWDHQVHPDSAGATLALLTVYFLDETEGVQINGSNLNGGVFTSEQAANAFRRTLDHLQTHFGRVDVPWGEVNRLRRGAVDLPIGGGPDVLHAVYGSFAGDGRLSGIAGDGLILIVGWSATGQIQAYSIHQYGSATLHPDSPHYANQAPLFAQRQLRPVWFTEADIHANLERVYYPGAE